MSELRNLEDHGKLGVEFVEVRKGQRICELDDKLCDMADVACARDSVL